MAPLGDQREIASSGPSSISKWRSVTQPGFPHQQETSLPSRGSYSICSWERNAGQEQTRRGGCSSAPATLPYLAGTLVAQASSTVPELALRTACHVGMTESQAGPLQLAGAPGPFWYWGMRDDNPLMKVSSQRRAERRWAGLCQHPWSRKREMEGWKRKNKNLTNTYNGPSPWDMHHP